MASSEDNSKKEIDQKKNTNIKADLKPTEQTASGKREADKKDSAPKEIRRRIVEYACKFEGNPYRYGGTSLTKGIDCSGFAQAVYRDNGIKIPRTSRQQAAGGKQISLGNIGPADLIFYGVGGTINHVAIYIGDGKVISASSKKYGIRITKYDYRQPYKAVSYIL